MKLFIDSAQLDELEKAYATGIVDGVTTNPSLVKVALDDMRKKKRKIDIATYITEILTLAKGTPVSLEVASTDANAMIEEGQTLYTKFNPLANNVVIKIPVNSSATGKAKNLDALRAIKSLSQARIPVNATLIFTPEQALLAAKAGATYISPFAGRVDDYIRTQHGIGFEKEDYYPAEGHIAGGKHIQDNGIVSGVDLVIKCVQIIKSYGFKTQVIAASIRNAHQLREVALAGTHIATIPFALFQNLSVHAKTIDGVKKFDEDMPSEYTKLAQGKK